MLSPRTFRILKHSCQHAQDARGGVVVPSGCSSEGFHVDRGGGRSGGRGCRRDSDGVRAAGGVADGGDGLRDAAEERLRHGVLLAGRGNRAGDRGGPRRHGGHGGS